MSVIKRSCIPRQRQKPRRGNSRISERIGVIRVAALLLLGVLLVAVWTDATYPFCRKCESSSAIAQVTERLALTLDKKFGGWNVRCQLDTYTNKKDCKMVYEVFAGAPIDPSNKEVVKPQLEVRIDENSSVAEFHFPGDYDVEGIECALNGSALKIDAATMCASGGPPAYKSRWTLCGDTSDTGLLDSFMAGADVRCKLITKDKIYESVVRASGYNQAIGKMREQLKAKAASD
jgi:hypothetical protein